MLPLPKHPNAEIVNKICTIVENQLLLNEEIKIVSFEARKEQLKQKIEYNEDKINSLVYKLYELNEEEIKLIENR